MRLYFNTYLSLLVMTAYLYANKPITQSGILSEDLRYELNTQEVILERIIKHYDKNNIIAHHNVASYYIEGYGAMFEVQRFPILESNLFKQFGVPDDNSKTKYVWSEEKNAIVKFESKHSKKDSIAVIKMVDDYIKDLHLTVFEFFADYMSEVDWLKENDKVCVHFDVSLYSKIPKEYNRAMVENIVPLSIQAIVESADLKKFRQRVLDIEQIDKKIKISKIFMNSQSYNFKILGDVIESAVRSIKEGTERPFNLHTTSIKIHDLGILYFLVAQHHSNKSFNNVESIFEFLFGKKSDNEDESNEEFMYDKSISELKLRLAKSVGQYAHKIKDLNENQSIVLLANIGRYGGFKSRFVMKIQKRLVDQLQQNIISMEEYLEKVKIYEEELYLNK